MCECVKYMHFRMHSVTMNFIDCYFHYKQCPLSLTDRVKSQSPVGISIKANSAWRLKQIQMHVSGPVITALTAKIVQGADHSNKQGGGTCSQGPQNQRATGEACKKQSRTCYKHSDFNPVQHRTSFIPSVRNPWGACVRMSVLACLCSQGRLGFK